MSACLQDYHGLPRLLLDKLGSKVKISDKQTPSRIGFSKLKCRHFLHKTSNLYILSGSYQRK